MRLDSYLLEWLLRRSGYLLLAALLFGPACTMATGPNAGNGATVERPNVLIFVTDDQAVGSLRGMRAVRKYFVKEGLKFTQAYATTPLCCPARASIFTGRYAHNHGVLTNTGEGLRDLSQKDTLTYYLHNAGYATAIFGKYLNKWPDDHRPPFFNRWSIFTTGNPFYGGAPWSSNGHSTSPEEYSTTYIDRRARKFLRAVEQKDDSQPWFLYVAPSAPHPPATPERKYRNSKVLPWRLARTIEERNRSDKPPYVRSTHLLQGRSKHVRRLQLQSLESVDDMVDHIFSLLDASDETRDTLAVFISDNGMTWWDHGLRGKTTPYTSSVRIPLMMRWPGHLEGGATDERLAANIDVAPTVLDATRIDARHAFDGRSLLASRDLRSRLLLEYWASPRFATPDWASILTRSRQYTEYYKDDRSRPSFRELYDLDADPLQLHNLLAGRDNVRSMGLSRLPRRLSRDKDCKGADCP